MIRGVIFDMDGVLIDAREWHFLALNEALGYFGLEISRYDHESRFDGLPTKVKLAMLSQDSGLPFGLHSTIEEIKQDRTLRFAAKFCFPSTQHQLLLGKIKSEGKKIGVATNSIKQTAEFMLQYAGVSQFLDTLVTNQDVSKPKPDPEIYISAAANLGLEPKECLVFEDNENGINAAKTAGCHVVQVASPSEVNLSQYFRAVERIEAN